MEGAVIDVLLWDVTLLLIYLILVLLRRNG
jgi:hypothetical protein